MSGRYRSTMLATTALFLLTAGSAMAADKVVCVPWEGDPAKQHTAIAGTAVQLTCVAKTDTTG